MSSTHTPGVMTHAALMGRITVGFREEGIFHCGVGLRTNDKLDEQEQNARRLVACWNACDGVPVEVLEANQAGGLPWNVGERIDDKVQTDQRMQALVDALAKTETYLLERLSSNPGSTGATVILPLIRRAIEGAGVAPTQSSWGDFPAT